MGSGARSRRTLAIALTTGLMGVIFAVSAGAATTVGETFTPTAPCNVNSTFIQTVSPGDAYVLPFSGVVTSWSFDAPASPPTVKLKIFRPAGGSNYTGVGDSAVETPAPSALNTYPTRIAAAAGDVLGLRTVTAGNCRRQPAGYTEATGGDDTAPGETSAFFSFPNNQIDVSAALEPDCDSDGLGDETQDGELLSCDKSLPSAQITKGPKDKTRKKRATFEFSGTDARAVASFQCSLDAGAFAACTSPHTVKVKKGKHTFQVRAIDQAGNVGTPASDAWKRKKKKRD
jgi:hypothetical protein